MKWKELTYFFLRYRCVIPSPPIPKHFLTANSRVIDLLLSYYNTKYFLRQKKIIILKIFKKSTCNILQVQVCTQMYLSVTKCYFSNPWAYENMDKYIWNISTFYSNPKSSTATVRFFRAHFWSSKFRNLPSECNLIFELRNRFCEFLKVAIMDFENIYFVILINRTVSVKLFIWYH